MANQYGTQMSAAQAYQYMNIGGGLQSVWGRTLTDNERVPQPYQANMLNQYQSDQHLNKNQDEERIIDALVGSSRSAIDNYGSFPRPYTRHTEPLASNMEAKTRDLYRGIEYFGNYTGSTMIYFIVIVFMVLAILILLELKKINKSLKRSNGVKQ